MATSDSSYWDDIHVNKKQDVSWWQESGDLWLHVLEHCDSQESDGAVDVGAGSSFFADALAQRGYSPIYVNDLSASALEVIAKRFADAQQEINVLPGSVLDLELKQRVGLWHDRAVFHFLTSTQEQVAYKQALLRNTTADADLIIATFAPDGPESCSGLPVRRWSTQELADFFAPEFTLGFSENRIHTTPWGGTQSFSVCVLHRIS
jgi:SAM-dependent methyltransferase